MKLNDAIPLDELPGLFGEDGDPGEFMQHASDYIFRYVRSRFRCSTDVAADFYIYLYDRIQNCLQTYHDYRDLSFSRFFTAYIRNSFRNFIKQQRRTELQHVVSMPGLSVGQSAQDSLRLNTLHDDSRTRRIWQLVDSLPDAKSLPFKLYYAAELNLKDLHYILKLTGDAMLAQQFIQDFHQRRQQRALRIERIRQRLDIIQTQLDLKGDQTRMKQDCFHRRQQRWKRRLMQIVHGMRGLYSLDELADLMQVSKSTVARRLERVRRLMKEGQIWQQENQMEAQVNQ